MVSYRVYKFGGLDPERRAPRVVQSRIMRRTISTTWCTYTKWYQSAWVYRACLCPGSRRSDRSRGESRYWSKRRFNCRSVAIVSRRVGIKGEGDQRRRMAERMAALHGLQGLPARAHMPARAQMATGKNISSCCSSSSCRRRRRCRCVIVVVVVSQRGCSSCSTLGCPMLPVASTAFTVLPAEALVLLPGMWIICTVRAATNGKTALTCTV